MSKRNMRFSFLFALVTSVFHQAAAAETITLEATSGNLSSSEQFDYVNLAGPDFSLFGSERGGVGYAHDELVPLGSPYDFSFGFSSRYDGYPTSFYGLMQGTINTPETGLVYALFAGSVATNFVTTYIPAGGAPLAAPGILTGSITGCVTPPETTHICDPNSPYNFLIPINLTGLFTQPYEYDPVTNTISYTLSAAHFVITPTAVPEPSTFALVAFFATGLTGVFFKRKDIRR